MYALKRMYMKGTRKIQKELIEEIEELIEKKTLFLGDGYEMLCFLNVNQRADSTK